MAPKFFVIRVELSTFKSYFSLYKKNSNITKLSLFNIIWNSFACQLLHKKQYSVTGITTK
jgi:hypothetical protein